MLFNGLLALGLPRTNLQRILRANKSLLLLALLPFALATTAYAQGGPPFRTDDPDTPGNKHWEINFGWIGDRNPQSGSYAVPDVDINYGLGDRIQLKYEIPIVLNETRALPATPTQPSTPGRVIGGLGESLFGIKWRFYEHHLNDPYIRDRFGTGLREVFGHHPDVQSAHSILPDASEPLTNFSLSIYPQLYVDNPTRSVPRGLVPPGPNFFLPLEINGRIGPVRFNGDVGYNFGNQGMPQSWTRGLLIGHEFTERTEAYIELYDMQDATRLPGGSPKQRETTLGLGGRRALNHAKTFNLLVMAGRSFQTTSTSTDNSQPSWIAYAGVQILLGPAEPTTRQVEQKLPNEDKR